MKAEAKNLSKNSERFLEIDFNSLTSEQVQQLLIQANKIIEIRRENERENAKMQILKLVNDFQIPFDELSNLLQSSDAIYTTHGRLKKIYVDHNNKNNKPWVGLGRRPEWIRIAIENGEDIEKYAVETSDDSKHTSTWFFNPNRPTQRWNGIGCKPIWFKELEDQNIDMDNYRISL